MSVSRITETAPGGNISLNNINTWANTNAIGHDRVSLTEWNTTTVPEVAAGSIFESAGGYYQVDTDTSITVGAVSDGLVYILFDSTLGSESFYFTNTEPTWDDAKQGYYDTGTGDKCLPFRMIKSGSSYSGKKLNDPNKRLGFGGDFNSGAWSKQYISSIHYWECLIYAGGQFVGVGQYSASGAVVTSPDGITWTRRSDPGSSGWDSLTYGNNIYVAVSNSGAGDRVMTSPDGITWTSRTPATANNWSSVCWSESLGLFAAVSSSGTGDRVMTSPDGITWTSRTSAADNNWSSVCWSESESLFVAVATSGTGNRVMTSPNGITWTSRTSAADNNWYSVTYGNGLFVAVATSGTGNRVMTSPDGITWTSRENDTDNLWYSVCWSDALELFVAVGIPDVADVIMTSEDGVTWTDRYLPYFSNAFNTVAFGDDSFVMLPYYGKYALKSKFGVI